MAKKIWNVNIEGINHTVELDHGYFSGKREITVDGKQLEKSVKVVDSGSDHVFKLDGHTCAIHIRTNGFTYNYDFSIDGKSVQTGKPIAFKNLSLDSPNLDDFSFMQLQLKIENKLKGGANWFYWIAGLSLLNSIIYVFGGNVQFIIGLGITQIFDGLIATLAKYYFSEMDILVRIIGMSINVVVAGVFVIFGIYARKQHRWAFITGMVLYAMDILILLWAKDLFGILFHIFALIGLFPGLKAINEIKKLTEKSTENSTAKSQ